MTERSDTQTSSPEVSVGQGAQAVAEGAAEAVAPPPAPVVEAPAPAVDDSAATPDRPEPIETVRSAADQRPELFVAGAFAGGLLLALLLKRASGG